MSKFINQGRLIEKECIICKKKFKRYKSAIELDGGKYCSHKCHGISKKGKIPWNKGKPLTAIWRKKLRQSLKGRKVWNKGRKHLAIRGKNHWNWKDGISKKNHILRNLVEYKNWRQKVFTRDNFTCQVCKKIGEYLESHHIKSFNNFPELRFDINNGITLCIDCHCKVDKYRHKLKTLTSTIP